MVCFKALVAMCSDMLCQRPRWSRSYWITREHSKIADKPGLNEDGLLLSGDDKVDDALSDWML